jgi:hypothetical protein
MLGYGWVLEGEVGCREEREGGGFQFFSKS